MTCTATIFSELLGEQQRGAYTAKLFGIGFPLYVEPLVFNTAGNLSTDYSGGFWQFYALSNGGFYMAPRSEAPLHVICTNGYVGDMSADAFGVTACLYAFSQLSFTAKGELAQTCTEQYHLLRDYMAEHSEVRDILAATD